MLATTLFTFQLDLYSLLSALLLYFCCFEDKLLFCLLIERNFVASVPRIEWFMDIKDGTTVPIVTVC
jgi:hypothetical protein